MIAARAAVIIALLPTAALAAPQRQQTAARAAAPVSGAGPTCSGEYADFLTAMSRETRLLEASPRAGYTYCLRTTATYEHAFYDKGGELRQRYLRHVRHGTGFGYQVKDGEYYVATNEHVVAHPAVTESDGEVEGVPAGARKVRESVRIVANEADDDDGSQVGLETVLVDEALDVAVLKTRQPLQVMPYRMGRSSALRVGNAVQVRGYPLGAFAASNTGRVIGVAQLDRERGWSHEDFATDAPLNAGNSGSPVFAISCRTGELELVGIYHAGYKDAQALNVVVAVDQLRDALLRLTPTRREAPSPLDRGALLAGLRAAPPPFVMPFGDRAVRVELARDTVRFAVLDGEYPLTSSAKVTLVAAPVDLARPAALLLTPRLGDRELAWQELDVALREPGQRLYDALWKQLASVLTFREVEAGERGAEARAALASVAARIRARRSEQREILQALDFQAEELTAPTVARPAAHGGAGMSPAAASAAPH